MNQCSWGPGQLEREIAEGVWLNLDTSNDLILCRGNFSDVCASSSAAGPFDHHEMLWQKIEKELQISKFRSPSRNSSEDGSEG
mmetsp:Transcript_29156/g.40561  ORF Transcript_29156/g.40561 Transcript_29156/m.40561 type:complete len:83 (-) Transcript_29156:153-401(-)